MKVLWLHHVQLTLNLLFKTREKVVHQVEWMQPGESSRQAFNVMEEHLHGGCLFQLEKKMLRD